jgi:hypothetical protein
MIGESGEAVPDTAEPVSAWRQWLWHPATPDRLLSRAVWEPGVALEARCLHMAKMGDSSTVATFNLIASGAASLHDLEWRPHPYCTGSPATPPSPPLVDVDDLGNERYYVDTTENADEPHGSGPRCGIYGWADPSWMFMTPMFPPHYFAINPDCVVVTGKVDLWGYVYEHEAGYRAQFAEPTEVFYTPWLPEQENAARTVATCFDIEATSVEEPDGERETEALREFLLTYAPPTLDAPPRDVTDQICLAMAAAATSDQSIFAAEYAWLDGTTVVEELWMLDSAIMRWSRAERRTEMENYLG